MRDRVRLVRRALWTASYSDRLPPGRQLESLGVNAPAPGGAETVRVIRSILIGLVAGLASGLLGVGGGIVLVPLLVVLLGLAQHRANATSLAAIIPIAAVGAATFALDRSVDYTLAGLLAAGAVAGAIMGARFMARARESTLQTVFGLFMVASAVAMVWP
jgi:uncharacterized protein